MLATVDTQMSLWRTMIDGRMDAYLVRLATHRPGDASTSGSTTAMQQEVCKCVRTREREHKRESARARLREREGERACPASPAFERGGVLSLSSVFLFAFVCAHGRRLRRCLGSPAVCDIGLRSVYW